MRAKTTKPAATLRIGLTGGIASGKSMTADYFSRLGISVIDADKIAHQLLAPGQPLLAQLTAEFGKDLLDDDGVLDRGRLRRLVFNSDAHRHRLEALMHPPIMQAMTREAAAVKDDYVVMVIPLLVETDARPLVDRVLVVDCPASVQIERLMQRDGIDQQLASSMLKAQATRDERLAQADDVISNHGSPDELERMVAHLDGFYRRLAADIRSQPGDSPDSGAAAGVENGMGKGRIAP